MNLVHRTVFLRRVDGAIFAILLALVVISLVIQECGENDGCGVFCEAFLGVYSSVSAGI
jgi:hypothetical protein